MPHKGYNKASLVIEQPDSRGLLSQVANQSIANARCYYFTDLSGQYLSEPGH